MNRIFQKAVFVSVGIHLVLMCVVTVVVGPYLSDRPQRLDVAFLGAIAEESLISPIPEGVVPAPAFQSGMKKRMISDRLPFLWETAPFNAQPAPVFEIQRGTHISARSGRNRFFTTLAPTLPSRPVNVQGEPSGLFFKIEGPARKRALVYVPTIQKRRTLDSFLLVRDIVVALKFRISEEGRVTEVVPILTSGYIEADLLAVRYLTRFRFAAAHGSQMDKMDWGVVRFPLSRMLSAGS